MRKKQPMLKDFLSGLFNIIIAIAFIGAIVAIWLPTLIMLKIEATLLLTNTGIFILNRVIK